MTHIACESKLRSAVRSSTHLFPENWGAIGSAVVVGARAAHAFSAGIKCRHGTYLLPFTCVPLPTPPPSTTVKRGMPYPTKHPTLQCVYNPTFTLTWILAIYSCIPPIPTALKPGKSNMGFSKRQTIHDMLMLPILYASSQVLSYLKLND